MSNKLKLNDKAIKEHISDWSYEIKDKEGNKIIKQKGTRAYTSFDVEKTGRLKGLVLCEYKDKEGNKTNKYFCLRYKFNGVAKYFTLGKFIPNRYGAVEVSDDLTELNKKHTNKKGYWITDPKIATKLLETQSTLHQVEEAQKKTLGTVIIELCKAGFPKIETAENLTAKSIKDRARYCIGYNWRIKHLVVQNNENGSGVCSFRANTRTRTDKPKDWDDLFKKYPSGHRIIKAKELNPNGMVSIFDSPLSALNLDQLRAGHIKKYIAQYNSHSVRQDVIECFHLIESFAVDKGYLGEDPRISPAKKVTNKKKRKKENKYFQKGFNTATLQKVCETAISLIPRFFFQPLMILLMAITGLRREEACILQKKHIVWEEEIIEDDEGIKHTVYGRIKLPPSVSKTETDQFIIITGPVRTVLKKIEAMGDYTLVDTLGDTRVKPFDFYKSNKFKWLFPTTKVNREKLFNAEYRNSDATRLKTDKNCWNAIKEKLGLEHCTSKMLRKTYTQKAKDSLIGRSDKAKHLTRHLTEAQLEGAYDGSELKEIQGDASKVAEVFDFIKKIA